MTLLSPETEETLDALDVMYELVLEDGSTWGGVACDIQKDDVEAIFRGDRNKHFITRPRGGSKTSDLAGVVAAWLTAEARPRSHAYVVAANADQAAEVIDAAAGLIERTPCLDGLVCENERILNEESMAWARVMPASDAGAWGKRDTHFLICDEFAQWPDTRGAKRVWTAVRTTIQKTPGCQLVILTSAGEPSHWSWPIFTNAKGGRDGWRVSEMQGPVPWQDPDELEALRHELLPSEYDRLILNVWAENEDRAISLEDYEAAARPAIIQGGGRSTTLVLKGSERPRPEIKYFIFVDIGTVNDATVVVVAHAELLDENQRSGPRRLVVDRLDRRQGTKKAPVQLSAVEDLCADLSGEWNRAHVVADPSQFFGHLQNLNRRGVKAQEFTFTTSSVGQVASALVHTFRNQLIVVPDAPVLKDELVQVKLRESSPGVTRLDHDRAGHDDQAVTIGMAAHTLVAAPKPYSAAVFRDYMSTRAERGGPSERCSEITDAFARRSRRLEGPLSRHHADQKRCQHRWRLDGSCAWGCGTSKD